MSAYDVALKYRKKHGALVYPKDVLTIPKRADFTSAALYGVALGEYEQAKEDRTAARAEYQVASRKVTEDFKSAIAKELGLTRHPKFERMYAIAWEHGHSSGYEEVANYADTLADLLR